MQEVAEGGARKRWPSLSLPRPPLPTLRLLDGLVRDSNHAATPSSDVSATLSRRKKKADEARRPKRQGKMSMMDAEHETIEAKTHLSFPTSMSQSAQRLLSGSLSRARSIRSCLSLIDILAILVEKI